MECFLWFQTTNSTNLIPSSLTLLLISQSQDKINEPHTVLLEGSALFRVFQATKIPSANRELRLIKPSSEAININLKFSCFGGSASK